jgi:AcrR family transcriptional regulator
MIRDPERTREQILKKSGILFNSQGYKATSISEITDATGFTKGAIYKHFKNKEDLEQATVFYLFEKLTKDLEIRVKAEKTAGDKLRSIFNYYKLYISSPPIQGGCPLANASAEADDANPALRKSALKMMGLLRTSLRKILENGIRFNQLKSTIDVEFYVTLIIACLEGAVMISKLERNTTDINRIIKHLENQIAEIEN